MKGEVRRNFVGLTVCGFRTSWAPVSRHHEQPICHTTHVSRHSGQCTATNSSSPPSLPKATPAGNDTTEWRSRTDKVDKHGAVTIRYAGRIRHLGVGRGNKGRSVLMLIHDREVSVSDIQTGEILGEYTIDPAKDYQPKKPS